MNKIGSIIFLVFEHITIARTGFERLSTSHESAERCSTQMLRILLNTFRCNGDKEDNGTSREDQSYEMSGLFAPRVLDQLRAEAS